MGAPSRGQVARRPGVTGYGGRAASLVAGQEMRIACLMLRMP
jgi:hypothetical protein